MLNIKSTQSPSNIPVIALATYNGERYIDEAISSFLGQDHPVTILARDDGSLDGTQRRLAEWAKTESGLFSVLPPSVSNCGPVKNFSTLLESVDGDRILLADQDDVWVPEKVSRLMSLMDSLERKYGPSTPLLVFSDSHVVDADMQSVSPSFWDRLGAAPPDALKLNRLVWGNVVQGCTMLCNSALLKQALPIPRQVLMHDWWLLLCAVALGKVGWVNDQLVMYRDHSSNMVGAPPSFLKRLRMGMSWGRISIVKEELAHCAMQAAALSSRFAGQLAPETADFLQQYARTREMNFWRRKRTCLRLRLRMASPQGTLMAYLAY